MNVYDPRVREEGDGQREYSAAVGGNGPHGHLVTGIQLPAPAAERQT